MAGAFDPSTLAPSATGRTGADPGRGITLEDLFSNVPGPTHMPKGLSSTSQISGRHPGMIEPGNIDLTNRPRVKNPDGSSSTVRSSSFNIGGKETLLPTVSDDGRLLSDDEAVDQFRRTGRHLGKFSSPLMADSYAQALHNQQAGTLVGGPTPLAANQPDQWGDYLKTMQYLTQPKTNAGPDARRAMSGMPAGPRDTMDDVQMQQPQGRGGQGLMALLFGGGGSEQ